MLHWGQATIFKALALLFERMSLRGARFPVDKQPEAALQDSE
jgi:hypothetical protein